MKKVGWHHEKAASTVTFYDERGGFMYEYDAPRSSTDAFNLLDHIVQTKAGTISRDDCSELADLLRNVANVER